MSDVPARLFFDYVDPLSFLLDREVRALERESGVVVDRHPVELRPPPAPLLDLDDAEWALRWEQAAASAELSGVTLAAAPFAPWTRKAHELALHARAQARFEVVHVALFSGFFEHGLDLGRVDVLVRLAAASGLDASETKAVLDVDRHAEEVVRLRAEAERAGVRGVPTLLVGGRLVEGLPTRDALRSLLGGAYPGSDPKDSSLRGG